VSVRGLTGTLAALLVLAAPSAALGDGAGDQQYQDPLAAPTTPQKPAKKKAAAQTAPAATAPAVSRRTRRATAPAYSAPAPAQLPRTGAPSGLIALAGALMVAAGVALRRRTATA
jgi:LPXTG-motif cell wall-anchored protein